MINPGTSSSSNNGNSRGRIRSVERVFRIFDYLEESGAEVGVIELAEVLGVHKSTASRFLATMWAEGYLSRNGLTDKYSLGMRIVELARVKLDQTDLRTYARPFLEQLSQKTGETIHLGVMEQGTLVYIDKIDALHMLTMRSSIGYRISPHCTALGKAILSLLPESKVDTILDKHELCAYSANTITDVGVLKAHLREVKKRGFAVDDEEHEIGIRCAAAPVIDWAGNVAGAISVSAPITRMTTKRLGEVGNLVKEVSEKLSTALGNKTM